MTSAAIVQRLTGRADIAIVIRFIQETVGAEERAPLFLPADRRQRNIRTERPVPVIQTPMPLLVLSFLLGGVTGLRSLTGAAAVCWAARLGWLHFDGTWLAFAGHTPALVVFTLTAIVELIVDKLPQAPARTKPPGLGARIFFGGMCGAALALASRVSVLPAAIAGIAGTLAGAFGGYHARHALVTRMRLPDFVVALAEDAIAIAGAFWIVSHV